MPTIPHSLQRTPLRNVSTLRTELSRSCPSSYIYVIWFYQHINPIHTGTQRERDQRGRVMKRNNPSKALVPYNPKTTSSNDSQGEGKLILRRKCKFSESKSHSKREEVYISKSRFKLSRQVQLKNSQEKERKHFGHRHPLRSYQVPEEDNIICSGCELELSGLAYGCTKCNFFIHKSCLDLPQQIRHKSHPFHTLNLRSYLPYQGRIFTCNACNDYGTAFHFHCTICQYDLHVDCAYLPKTVGCRHHEDSLTLFYRIPFYPKEGFKYCNVCKLQLYNNFWCYYCVDCNYGTHLECATAELAEEEEEVESSEEEFEYHLSNSMNQFENIQMNKNLDNLRITM